MQVQIRQAKNTREGVLGFKRLKDGYFPVEVEALPHVISAIDTLLMTPLEAMVEAAKTSQLEWLRYLADYYDDSEVLRPAIVAVSKDGHSAGVRLLILEVIEAQIGTLNDWSVDTLTDAAVAAARNGHLAVVGMLLEKIEADRGDGDDGDDDDQEEDDDEEEDDDPNYDESETETLIHKAAWGVLEAGAKNGDIDMVKLAAAYAKEEDEHSYASDALELAINGNHVGIVRFLLEPGRFTWEFPSALEQAIDGGQDEIAKMIYRDCGVENFFSVLAQQGGLNAVVYVYDEVIVEQAVINDAFISAARYGCTDIAAFLIGSGPIDSHAFDSAFEGAATAGKIYTVKFLCDQHRVSRSSLNTAFETTQKVSVLRFLHAKEYIPVESIVSAFKNAGHCGYTEFSYPAREQQKLLQFLVKETCIPNEIINEVAAKATLEFRKGILQCLCGDPRLSPNVITEVFRKGIDKGSVEVVRDWYSEKFIAPEVVSEGLIKAAGSGDCAIVKYLLDKPDLTITAKHDAIVSAAQNNRREVVQYMCNHGEWSDEVLGEVLDDTNDKKILEFVREHLDCSSRKRAFTFVPIERFILTDVSPTLKSNSM